MHVRADAQHRLFQLDLVSVSAQNSPSVCRHGVRLRQTSMHLKLSSSLSKNCRNTLNHACAKSHAMARIFALQKNFVFNAAVSKCNVHRPLYGASLQFSPNTLHVPRWPCSVFAFSRGGPQHLHEAPPLFKKSLHLAAVDKGFGGAERCSRPFLLALQAGSAELDELFSRSMQEAFSRSTLVGLQSLV